jgi:hypothetical protein
MEQEQMRALVMFIGAGMKVLSIRLTLLLTLAMTFALFVWAMYSPVYERITSAAIFTVLVFLPVIRADMRQNERSAVQGE